MLYGQLDEHASGRLKHGGPQIQPHLARLDAAPVNVRAIVDLVVAFVIASVYGL